MRIHLIIHESFEAPGAIEIWAQKHGHKITYSRVYLGDTLPQTTEGFDFLFIMGAPQSPATTTEESPHFDAKAEINLIKKSIDVGKAVLWICTGAQLIGEALGARFDHSPNKEIGIFDITLTEAGQRDPFFSTFPEVFPVGHWHGDMPGLTPDAEVLATSEGCPRQIVRYTPRVYGFQCHFEFTPDSIEAMIENSTEELEKYAWFPYVENAQTLRSHDWNEINNRLFQFLDYIETLRNI